METEERPLKIRKIEVSSETVDTSTRTDVQEVNDLEITSKLDGEEENAPQAIAKSPTKADPLPFGPESTVDVFPNLDLDGEEAPVDDGASPTSIGPHLSKNQLKKIKRKQEWEAGRDFRKAKRKEKIQDKKRQKREAHEQVVSAAVEGATSGDHTGAEPASQPEKREPFRSVQLPVTFVIDCGFDDLMLEKELISLASQVTRCYSDNWKSKFKAHMEICSFNGKLKERFDTVLYGQHHSWKNVRFLDGDFVEAAEQAKERMFGEHGGTLAASFAPKEDGADSTTPETGEVIYLTSDSPNTLTEVKPYSTYIIGGIVDKNRHKGICYRRAMDRDVQTARLPIGEYMKMDSRFVLTTNHVCEIMLKWLEMGDWGHAFMKVMPKRKGGVLKGSEEGNVAKCSEEGE